MQEKKRGWRQALTIHYEKEWVQCNYNHNEWFDQATRLQSLL